MGTQDVYGFVGVLYHRFGPSFDSQMVTALWCPVSHCTSGGVHGQLDDKLVGGIGLMMVFSCYVPLLSLVVHVVPARVLVNHWEQWHLAR